MANAANKGSGARDRGTTAKTGANSIARSRESAPSTKTSVDPQLRVFGTSSQFRGIGTGVPGDPRK